MRSVDDQRVLVWAPRGRDAGLAVDILARSGFAAVAVADVDALCSALAEGAGCALLTEDALTPDVIARLGVTLSQQPPWSDMPLLIFGEKLRYHATIDASSPLGNVTYLDRPVQIRTLLAAVRVALRSRIRQYAARTAIERRDEFVAMLGHELRNPLAAIVFATEMLGRDCAEAERHRQRAIIGRQARHLCRLVDDLLDVARITTGKVVLRTEAVDIVALAQRCVQQIAMMAQEKCQSVELDVQVDTLVVDGDPVRIEQILANLLTNAVKYTPEGGHVRVSVAREDDDAILRVRDDGVGIDPTQTTAIFELFAQAPASLDRSAGGLGLGLTLVRSLVAMHRGRVEARSDGLGLGSEFVVRLPVLAGPTLVREPEADQASPQPMHVVLVDDNADMREMLAGFLGISGHRVDTAADGPIGLATILALRPEVAIIDIGLPGLDGYELARRVRAELGHAIRLVAMTGYGQPEDRRRTREAGFDVHLVKPAAPADVLASLASGPARLAESS